MAEHNWHEIDSRLALLVEGGKVETISEAAKVLGVNRKTLAERLLAVFDTTAGNFLKFPEALDKYEREGAEVVEKIFEDKEENSWAINALDRRVKSLEDLLLVCKVDLNVWRVDRWVANKWEVGIAERNKRDGSAKVHPLYQIKAWLCRIDPVAIMPTVQPITIEAKLPKPRTKKSKPVYRALAIYDIQGGFRRNLQTGELVPFHDRRVLDIALQLLEFQEFDNVIFGGDELDLSEWSTHWTAEPEFYFTTQAALIEIHWWLAQFRLAAPNAEMDMLDGNHNRFENAIVTHLKAAYQLRPADELHRDAVLSLPRMLALDKLNINYVDGYKNGSSRKWLNDNISFTHGNLAKANPGSTAGAMVGKNYSTTIFGHIHRRELATKTIPLRDGHVLATAFCPGCACHVDGRVPGSREDSQWQQGLVVVEYSEDGGHHIVPVEIDSGVSIYAGQQFVARERDDEAGAVILSGMKAIEKGGGAHEKQATLKHKQ